MTRARAIELAEAHLDSGDLLRELTRKVAYPTESEADDRDEAHRSYLRDEIVPGLRRCGFTWRLVENPVAGMPPFLLARRVEDPALRTVLVYGHGDVVRGDAAGWSEPWSPWRLVVDGDRWYGRGSCDNKGQHAINLAALEQVLLAREGRLGFNVTVLMDMGEEIGSPGLREVCTALADDELAADVLLASDGTRVSERSPTLVLGTRGEVSFTLRATLRPRGYHSGNWGGLLGNPAVLLANALATMVDARGRILVEGLRPPAIPEPVRTILRRIEIDGGPTAPAVEDWGEPGLSAAERLYGWNTLEVLGLDAGTATGPQNAIPGTAAARCQLRFVVGTDWSVLERTVRTHLDAHGFGSIDVEVDEGTAATRLDPDDAWVSWAAASVERTTGKAPTILPNLGGTFPNDCFAEVLGIPTVWVPHSYPGCAQHAPDEHLLASLAREALGIMAGLLWDLGELPASAGG
ncbi:M20 family metallopeptidase [Nocardioides sp. LHD-245]|uniref:M20 family metallopeptidase n=1 Tax=Nocardioides sp. LHD-245 TaxID=3051387 RepID=UPI0027E18EA4|nr:M20 family metallopeptidase [Nocardioides sp. LHD-245]